MPFSRLWNRVHMDASEANQLKALVRQAERAGVDAEEIRKARTVLARWEGQETRELPYGKFGVVAVISLLVSLLCVGLFL